MAQVPTLIEMLKAGVHFGHRRAKRYPKMKPHVFTTRGEVDIVDLGATQQKLGAALDFLRSVAAKGGSVLFVGTKRQARDLVVQAAQSCGQPFVAERWLGGTLTNLRSILQLTQKLGRIEQQQQSGELVRYTKKEQAVLGKEAAQLSVIVGGLQQLKGLPQALYVVDVKREKTAVVEANRVNVPVVAVCDTNVNPDRVQWPIPGNDDAVKAIELMLSAVAGAINEGREDAKAAAEAASQA